MWVRSLQLDSAYVEIPAAGDRWVELDPYSQTGYLLIAQAANQNGDGDRARDIIATIDALEVEVSDLQIARYATGGARVSGSVANKTLDQGATVTLTFTFYTAAGGRDGYANPRGHGGRRRYEGDLPAGVQHRGRGGRLRLHAVDRLSAAWRKEAERGGPVIRSARFLFAGWVPSYIVTQAGVAQLVEHQLPKLSEAP